MNDLYLTTCKDNKYDPESPASIMQVMDGLFQRPTTNYTPLTAIGTRFRDYVEGLVNANLYCCLEVDGLRGFSAGYYDEPLDASDPSISPTYRMAYACAASLSSDATSERCYYDWRCYVMACASETKQVDWSVYWWCWEVGAMRHDPVSSNPDFIAEAYAGGKQWADLIDALLTLRLCDTLAAAFAPSLVGKLR